MNRHWDSTFLKYTLIIAIATTVLLSCGGAVSATGNMNNIDSPPTHLSADQGRFAGSPSTQLSSVERNSLSIQANNQRKTVHSVGYNVSEGTTNNIEAIEAQKVWNRFNTQGEGATVAIIDTGVNTEAHPELEPIDGGWKDFTNEKDTPYDVEGHGTSVAGIIAGERITDAGLPSDHYLNGAHYGIAPDVNLIYAQAANDQGNIGQPTVKKALEWLIDHEADIDVVLIEATTAGYVNPDYNENMILPIQTLREQGTVVVVPTGNAGDDTVGSPASVYESFTVGATESDVRTDPEVAESSSGKKVDVSEDWGKSVATQQDWPAEYIVPDVTAPGRETVTADENGGYVKFSGTSAAGPHVAATVALMQSASEENLQPAEIEEAIRSTAYHPDGDNAHDTRFGHGYINSFEAVNKVAERHPTIEIHDVRYVGADPNTDIENGYNVEPMGGHSEHKFEFDVKNVGQYGETRTITWEFRTAANLTGLNNTERTDAIQTHDTDHIEVDVQRVKLNPGEKKTVRTSLPKEYLNKESSSSLEAVHWKINNVDIRTVIKSDLLKNPNETATNHRFRLTLNDPETTDESPTSAQNETSPSKNETNQDTSNRSADGTPGFGISSALISLAGGAYLSRRVSADG